MIGTYVSFKNKTFLVVAERGGLLLITDLESKKQVARRNVTPTRCKPAAKVTYREHEYLVTGKGHIFSLRTCKLMKWKEYHRERLDILAAAA